MRAATVITTPAGELPFHFGMAALSAFLDEEKMQLSEVHLLGQDMPLSRAFRLMWHGFRDGARKERTEFTYTMEDMADWLDEDFSLFDTCMNLFASSLPQGTEGNGQRPGKTKARR